MQRCTSGSMSVSAYAAVNPAACRRVVVEVTPAGHGDHRHAGRTRRGRHPGRRLAVQGLLVQAALTGDHQPGAVERGPEADQVEHHVDARPRRAPSTAIAA